MNSQLFRAQSSDITIKRRHRPWEPITPAYGCDDLREKDSEHSPAKRRQIAASHAGYEGHRSHEQQSHCGGDKDIAQRLQRKLIRPAGDVYKGTNNETD